MAVYTYDEEADALYVLLVPDAEAGIKRTVEIDPRLHVDLDDDDRVVGVEILNPADGDGNLDAVRERFGVALRLPFRFAA